MGVYVLFMCCLCVVYVLFMCCLCVVYVLFMCCLCVVYVWHVAFEAGSLLLLSICLR